MFFRAQTIGEAFSVFRSILTEGYNIGILFDGSLYKLGIGRQSFWIMIASIVILLFADIFREKAGSLRAAVQRQEIWLRWAVWLIGIWSIILFGIYGSGYDASGFIYFQF